MTQRHIRALRSLKENHLMMQNREESLLWNFCNMGGITECDSQYEKSHFESELQAHLGQSFESEK